MQTTMFPDISELKDPKKPIVADGKEYYLATEKAKAFEARYGKPVFCVVTIENYENKQPKECTLRIQSAKNKKYVITEYLTPEGTTQSVLLCYTHGPHNIQTQFNRYRDAEVTLADLIAEE